MAKRGRWVAKRGRWVAKRGRWVAMGGRWVAKRGIWVAKRGIWVAKRGICHVWLRVGRAPACYSSSLGSKSDISQKHKMGDIIKRVANTLYSAKNIPDKSPLPGSGRVSGPIRLEK